MEKLIEAFDENDVDIALSAFEWLKSQNQTVEDVQFFVQSGYRQRDWVHLIVLKNWLKQNDKTLDELLAYFGSRRRKLSRLRRKRSRVKPIPRVCETCKIDMKLEVWEESGDGHWTCPQCRTGIYFEDAELELKKRKITKRQTLDKQFQRELDRLRENRLDEIEE